MIGEEKETRDCFTTKEKLETITGGALEWGVIEFFICVTFVFSMFALVCKSRFVKVGIDNS